MRSLEFRLQRLEPKSRPKPVVICVLPAIRGSRPTERPTLTIETGVVRSQDWGAW